MVLLNIAQLYIILVSSELLPGLCCCSACFKPETSSLYASSSALQPLVAAKCCGSREGRKTSSEANITTTFHCDVNNVAMTIFIISGHNKLKRIISRLSACLGKIILLLVFSWHFLAHSGIEWPDDLNRCRF